MAISVRQVRTTGGGAKSAFWRQLQADVYNAPVATTNSEEGAAFGAALLAGVGLGTYKSVPAACKQLIKAGDVVRPRSGRWRRTRSTSRSTPSSTSGWPPTFQEIKGLEE